MALDYRDPCPSCGNRLLLPFGTLSAKILIAQGSPSVEDIIEGIPFRAIANDILRKELFRHNTFQPKQCRFTSLWLHKKTPKTCDVELHKEAFLQECLGVKYVLMLGSEFGKGLIYDGSVTNMYGVRIPLSDGVVGIPGPSLYTVQKDGVGELRHALFEMDKLIEEGANVANASG